MMNHVIKGETFFHGYLKDLDIKEEDKVYKAYIIYDSLLTHDPNQTAIIEGKICDTNEIYNVLIKAKSIGLSRKNDRNIFFITCSIQSNYMECLRVDKYVRTLLLRADME